MGRGTNRILSWCPVGEHTKTSTSATQLDLGLQVQTHPALGRRSNPFFLLLSFVRVVRGIEASSGKVSQQADLPDTRTGCSRLPIVLPRRPKAARRCVYPLPCCTPRGTAGRRVVARTRDAYRRAPSCAVCPPSADPWLPGVWPIGINWRRRWCDQTS